MRRWGVCAISAGSVRPTPMFPTVDEFPGESALGSAISGLTAGKRFFLRAALYLLGGTLFA